MRRVSNGRSAEPVGIAQPIVRCGESRCERPRRQIAECRMWAVIVVVDDPTGERRPSMVEVAEQGLVEEFVPHPAVECLADAVLHRSSGSDVVPLDADLLRPQQDGIRTRQSFPRSGPAVKRGRAVRPGECHPYDATQGSSPDHGHAPVIELDWWEKSASEKQKPRKSADFRGIVGGAEGNRTPDLCSAIAALSHLSYSPDRFGRGNGSPRVGWAPFRGGAPPLSSTLPSVGAVVHDDRLRWKPCRPPVAVPPLASRAPAST